MISCDHAKNLFSDFIENNLNDNDLRSVSQHLEHCADCRQVFNDVQFLSERLKNLQQLKISPEFDRNLRRRISQGPETKPIITVRGFSYGFSGMAIVATATFLVFNTFSTPKSSTQSFSPAESVIPVSNSASSVKLEKQPTAAKNAEKILAHEDSLKRIPAHVDQNKIKLAEQEK